VKLKEEKTKQIRTCDLNYGCAPAALCVLHFRNLNVCAKPHKLQLPQDALGIEPDGLKFDWQLACAELR